MRIKLSVSKQRELILTFKTVNKLTWIEMTKQLNVNKGALLEWYHENNLIPKKIYEKSTYTQILINTFWRKNLISGGNKKEGSYLQEQKKVLLFQIILLNLRSL